MRTLNSNPYLIKHYWDLLKDIYPGVRLYTRGVREHLMNGDSIRLVLRHHFI